MRLTTHASLGRVIIRIPPHPETTRPTGRTKPENFRYLQTMTAVRLRGQEAHERALEAYRLNTMDGWTVKQIAKHYNASPRAVYAWLELARRLTLPALEDKREWFEKIVSDIGSRLEGAKDGDAVRIADTLAKMLGVGSAEQLRYEQVRIESAKVALIAEAFDRTILGLPNQKALRQQFLDSLEVVEETRELAG